MNPNSRLSIVTLAMWCRETRSIARIAFVVSLITIIVGCRTVTLREPPVPLPPPTALRVHSKTQSDSGDARVLPVGMSGSRSEGPRLPNENALLSALRAWDELERMAADGATDVFGTEVGLEYEERVKQVVRQAMAAGPIDASGGLHVAGPDGPVVIPVVTHGLAWTPDEINRLFQYQWSTQSKLRRRHRRSGWGVPMVAVRRRPVDEPRMEHLLPFSVTLVLRRVSPRSGAPTSTAALNSAVSPNSTASHNSKLSHGSTLSQHSAGNSNPLSTDAVLELYDPVTLTTVDVAGRGVPLAGDLSAPLEYLLHAEPGHALYELFMPGANDARSSLRFVEPYQAGKIPVVFVHGLASDAATWVDALNELRASPEFARRYQVWIFQYATGRGFLGNAADLREQLYAARMECDPEHHDAALDSTVLVGHSMGGLLCKMQVTSSGDRFWREFSRRPLDSLRVSPAMRQILARNFFFEPVPHVRRVVFIGTPHKGASLARRPLARLASISVKYSHEEVERYRELVIDNLDSIYPWAWSGQPTSVDMLIPDTPALNAMRQLPFGEGVEYHSIIGTEGLVTEGTSDGVVDVSSARHRGAISEVYVSAGHSELLKNMTTVAELLRILEEHAAMVPVAGPASNTAPVPVPRSRTRVVPERSTEELPPEVPRQRSEPPRRQPPEELPGPASE